MLLSVLEDRHYGKEISQGSCWKGHSDQQKTPQEERFSCCRFERQDSPSATTLSQVSASRGFGQRQLWWYPTQPMIPMSIRPIQIRAARQRN